MLSHITTHTLSLFSPPTHVPPFQPTPPRPPARPPPPITPTYRPTLPPGPPQVRGATYLSDRKKVPAAPPLFELVAADLLELEEPLYNICRYLPSVK